MSIDYEVEYNNRARVPEHPEIFARWERDSAAYREFRGESHDAPIDVPSMFRQAHELRQAMKARAC